MAKRTYGTGALYEKRGGYYGCWRTGDGRQLNRRIGPMRLVGREGLTRAPAERAFHRLQAEENRRPRPTAEQVRTTVNVAAESLRRQRELEGARKSYLQGLESMQRVHISDAFGDLPLSKVTTAHVESLAGSLMRRGLAPKTVRNVIAFLHSIFEHAISTGWCIENPVRRAAAYRPTSARPASSTSTASTPMTSARLPEGMGVVIGNGDGETVQIAAPPSTDDPVERIDIFAPPVQIPVDDADDDGPVRL